MQINISNRGAVLLVGAGAVAGALAFAPEQVDSLIEMIGSALAGT